MTNRFYIYVHKDKDDKIFYVGKGTNKRHNSKAGRSVAWHKKVSGENWTSEILVDGLTNDEAIEIEDGLISLLKITGGIVNHTNPKIRDYNKVWSSLYEYDEESPSGLIYKRTSHNCIKEPAGWNCDVQKPYWIVSGFGEKWLAHRVIWCITHGSISDRDLINHIDNNSLNNKISNLELSNPIMNAQNTKKQEKALEKGSYIKKVKIGESYYFLVEISRNLKKLAKSFSFNLYGGEERALDCAKTLLDAALVDIDKASKLDFNHMIVDNNPNYLIKTVLYKDGTTTYVVLKQDIKFRKPFREVDYKNKEEALQAAREFRNSILKENK